MMSQLSTQLRKLQQRPETDSKLSVSFLFTNADAKQLSREQVHELAVSGLQTLVSIDNRFNRFLKTVFELSSIRKERGNLMKSENELLNKEIEAFLTMLSPHLFLTASHQAFEYLVRVHEVQTHNVSAVIRAFLPYHDHAIFARVILLLDLRDTGFDFLSKNQLHGSVLLRQHLLTACAENRKVLRMVCDAAAYPIRAGVHNNAALSLFAGCATALSTHSDGESIFRVLLPFLLKLVSTSISDASFLSEETDNWSLPERDSSFKASGEHLRREMLSTALLVLCSWCIETQLTPQTLSMLLRPLIQEMGRSTLCLPVSDVLGALGLVFRSQRSAVRDVTFTPVISLILSLPWPAWKASVPPGTTSLISTLIEYCLGRLTVAESVKSVSQEILDFLIVSATSFQLTEGDVARVLSTIAQHGSLSSECDRDSFTVQVISALERRFSLCFDTTIAKLLQTEKGNVSCAKAVMNFVTNHFSGSRYELVDVTRATSGSQEQLPLLSCLLHHLPEVRILAIHKLRDISINKFLGDSNALASLLLHVIRTEHHEGASMACLEASSKLVRELLEIHAASQKGSSEQLVLAERLVENSYIMVGAALTSQLKSVDSTSPLVMKLTSILIDAVKYLSNRSTKEKNLSAQGSAANLSSAFPIYFLVLLYGMVTSMESPSVAVEPLQEQLTRLFPTFSGGSADSIYNCLDLLCSIAENAVQRLPILRNSLFTAMRHNESTRYLHVEGCIALTACCASGLGTDESFYLLCSTSAAQSGYLVQLNEHQLEEQMRSLKEGTAASHKVGRAANRVTKPTSNNNRFSTTPTDLFTERLRHALQLTVQKMACNHIGIEPNFLKILGELHGVMPALATSPKILAPLLFSLLSIEVDYSMASASTTPSTNWFGLVEHSIFEEVPLATPGDMSPCALPMILLLPLLAPDTASKQRVLQHLQDFTVRAMGKKATPKIGNGAELAFGEACRSGRVSSTALSSIIECMALEESDSKEANTLTPEAASLLASYVVDPATLPFHVATRTLATFFPLTSAGGKGNSKLLGIQAALLEKALPMVQKLLSSESISSASAQLLEGVLSRLTIQSDTAGSGAAVAMCKLLLEKHSAIVHASTSFRVTNRDHESSQGGDKTIPLYRYALTALSQYLSLHLEEGGPRSVIFNPNKKTVGRKGEASAVEKIALEFIQPVMSLWRVVGRDVSIFLSKTHGGYKRLFIPYLISQQKEVHGGEHTANLELVGDVLEELLTTTTTEGSPAAFLGLWEVPSGCYAPNALISPSDAKIILDLCRSSLTEMDGQLRSRSVRQGCRVALRTLSQLVRAAPAVYFDEDEDGEAETLYGLLSEILTATPVSSLSWAFTAAPPTSHQKDRENEILTLGRSALEYVNTLVQVCLSHQNALNVGIGSLGNGARRIGMRLVKDVLLLTTTMLAPHATELAAEDDGDQSSSVDDRMALTVSGLLRAIAPILSSVNVDADRAAFGEVTSTTFQFLHIPLVALLIKLESVENTEALQFRTSLEVCQLLINSFDLHTQMQCLSNIMGLLMDPEGHCTSMIRTSLISSEDEAEITTMFRKLIKPNKITNRQERILNLLSTSLKADAFLGAFIEMQQHSSNKKDVAEAEGEAGDAEAGGKHDACMPLLLNTLQLYGHYQGLNEQVTGDTEDLSALSEEKAYAMTLELLSGNILACVLAGINETTFTECQRRLLTDSRHALQLKGLETLMDRLHQSLPTVENEMTDEELAQRRRDLRDPKKKITLLDLMRLKARPLTTKRSFSTFTPLFSIFKGAVTTLFGGKSLTVKAELQLYRTAQLALSCMEELVRIVGSGGSKQAEKTLLNTRRQRTVTEATLTKLYGNKSRVTEVHTLVETGIIPALEKLVSQKEMKAEVRAAAAFFQGSLSTVLATIVQINGSAFTTAHCNAILTILSEVGVHSVNPAQRQGSGNTLVRRSVLNALIRCLPSTWIMCHPHVPSILYFTTHQHNMDDGETQELATELLAVLETLLDARLLLESCTTCLQGDRSKGMHSISAHTHAVPVLFRCIGRLITKLDREELRSLSILMTGSTPQDNFWLASLAALSSHDLPSEEVLCSVFEAYTSFFIKFKAKHCVRFLTTVAEWSFSQEQHSNGTTRSGEQKPSRCGPIDDGDDTEGEEEEEANGFSALASRQSTQRWIVFLALFNHLMEKLEALLDFGFPIATSKVVTLLTSFGHSNRQNRDKRVSGYLALVLEGALDTIRRIASAQCPGPEDDLSIPREVYFATPEVFAAVMPALVHQLSNVTYLTDDAHSFTFRAQSHITPALRAFFKTMNNSKLQSQTQAEMLRMLRNPNHHVRRAVLSAFRGIYLDGGEEMAARLMAEMLPAVVEMTEDTHDDVVEEARLLCNDLSAITGQDVLHAMN